MDLSIIIPTKDRGKIFDEALQSVIQAIDGLHAEVIIINDSKTSFPSISPSLYNVRIVNNPKSGVASARNLGASLAQSELLLFMDDDFILPPDSIRLALELAARNSLKIHLFNWIYPPTLQQHLSKFQFGRYLTAHQFTTVQGWLGNEWREEAVFELKDGASYFLPIQKSLFNTIGRYDERFPHAGAEDYDFIQRAKAKGVKFYLDKTCTIYHNESDRIDLKNWLKRKERNGETIKLAFDQGHQKMAIHYPSIKRKILVALSTFDFSIFALLRLIPNISLLDYIYFKFVNILLAIHIFRGYTKKRKVQ